MLVKFGLLWYYRYRKANGCSVCILLHLLNFGDDRTPVVAGAR